MEEVTRTKGTRHHRDNSICFKPIITPLLALISHGQTGLYEVKALYAAKNAEGDPGNRFGCSFTESVSFVYTCQSFLHSA